MKCWQIRYLPGMISNRITFLRKRVQVGENTRIYGKVIVKGTGEIKIGNNCLINSSVHADPIGGDARTILRADSGASLVIGNGCGLSNCAIVAQKEIVIHDEVYIGGGCRIYDTDFHSLDRAERVAEIDTHVRRSGVEIMEGAFIGAHSIILKGVTVGKNSIVGAGSVVTGNIPDHEVWAGNPARKVRDL